MLSKVNIEKWIAYIIVFLVLVGYVLISLGALDFLRISPQQKQEFILIATFVLVAQLVTIFFSGQKKTIDTLKKISSDKNTLRYHDDGLLNERLKNIVESSDYDEILLAGSFFVDSVRSFRDIARNYKYITVITSVDNKNKKIISSIMSEYSDKLKSKNIIIRHTEPGLWGDLVVTKNSKMRANNGKAIIVNKQFSKMEDNSYFYGKVSYDFYRNIELSLLNSELVDLSSSAIIDYLTGERFIYRTKLNGLKFGAPHYGVSSICKVMSKLLKKSEETLDVTHISTGDDNVSVIENDSFQEWINENYRSAERGVKIRRIFIMNKRDKLNKAVFDTMKCMETANENISVYYCYRDEIDDSMVRDFSIYDKKTMVYIESKSAGWKNVESMIRESKDEDILHEYEERFLMLLSHSERYTEELSLL